MSYRIDPGKPLGEEVHRIADEQIDRAMGELAEPAQDRHEAIHDVRKRFKKLRGLLRLVRAGNENLYAAENARYRDAARRLSAVRDQTALIEALGGLKTRFEGQFDPEAYERISQALQERRGRAIAREGDLDAAVEATLADLREGRGRLAVLVLPAKRKRAGAFLAQGVVDTYRRGRRGVARAGRSDTAADFHELRKRVKYHAMHLQLLEPLWPQALEPLKEQAKALGDDLGTDHDYAVFREVLADKTDMLGRREDRDLVLDLIGRRQRELRRAGLDGARQLFVDKGEAVRRRFSRLYARAGDAA